MPPHNPTTSTSHHPDDDLPPYTPWDNLHRPSASEEFDLHDTRGASHSRYPTHPSHDSISHNAFPLSHSSSSEHIANGLNASRPCICSLCSPHNAPSASRTLYPGSPRPSFSALENPIPQQCYLAHAALAAEEQDFAATTRRADGVFSVSPCCKGLIATLGLVGLVVVIWAVAEYGHVY